MTMPSAPLISGGPSADRAQVFVKLIWWLPHRLLPPLSKACIAHLSFCISPPWLPTPLQSPPNTTKTLPCVSQLHRCPGGGHQPLPWTHRQGRRLRGAGGLVWAGSQFPTSRPAPLRHDDFLAAPTTCPAHRCLRAFVCASAAGTACLSPGFYVPAPPCSDPGGLPAQLGHSE